MKNKERLFALFGGVSVIVINFLWIYPNIDRLYGQSSHGSILYLFLYPTWILLLNTTIGIIGIFLGIRIIREKINIRNGILISITNILLCILIGYLVMYT